MATLRARASAALAVLALATAGAVVCGCDSRDAWQVLGSGASCRPCHEEIVTTQSRGPHAAADCPICHASAEAHAQAADPKAVLAGTDWRIGACAGCHRDEAATYLYDDNAQPGPFGGSQRVPPQPKTATFPSYNTIIKGHAFTRDYAEEGAHAWMLADHRRTLRGKFEPCLECKSTKVAYAWLKGKPLTVATETPVLLSHTATVNAPARTLVVPAGTKVTLATDPKTRAVEAVAVYPGDAVRYVSRKPASAEETRSHDRIWAAMVAAIAETDPYGAGCNHCHDPHSTRPRLVRQALLQSIEAQGVSPYDGTLKGVTSFARAPLRIQRSLTCAQCHVEYTCGKSGVDGIDRDAWGWAKAADLHKEYQAQFDYKQDWTHAIIGQPLIKSQHPETELFWDSVHYRAGLSCSECHMPRVLGSDGRYLRSHWFTSPYKYESEALFARFSAATGVRAVSPGPCDDCHADREGAAIAQQRATFAEQKAVQAQLVRSVAALGAVPVSKRTGPTYGRALDAHRRAHVLWENLIVSENSMGFHDYEEVSAAMVEALKLAREAETLARQAAR